jgi:hypothetical protein
MQRGSIRLAANFCPRQEAPTDAGCGLAARPRVDARGLQPRVSSRLRYDLVALLGLLIAVTLGSYVNRGDPVVILVALVLVLSSAVGRSDLIGRVIRDLDAFLMAVAIRRRLRLPDADRPSCNTLAMGPGGYRFGEGEPSPQSYPRCDGHDPAGLGRMLRGPSRPRHIVAYPVLGQLHYRYVQIQFSKATRVRTVSLASRPGRRSWPVPPRCQNAP